MGRLRILHISDLHERVAPESASAERRAIVALDAAHRGELLDERFYDELAELARTAIDLICFTGDVADWGLPAEYALVTPRLHRILAATGVPLERLFVVPGNHDVQRFVNRPAWQQLREAAADDPAAVGRYLAGHRPPRGIEAGCREQVLERTSAFWGWVRNDLGRAQLAPPAHSALGYRSTLALRDTPVHVIGLDSAWLCGDDNDQGKILVTSDQVRLLTRDGERELSGFRLALLHHPLDHLADHHAIRRLLGRQVDLLLHGHQHEPVAIEAVEPETSIKILAAGCLVEGLQGAGWPNQFQLIEVDVAEPQRRISVYFRQWSPRGFWTVGSSLYKQATDGVLHWQTSASTSRHAAVAPAHVARWEARIHDSQLWDVSTGGPSVKMLRAQTAALARTCQSLVEAEPEAGRTQGAAEPWADPGLVDRTISAIELLAGASGWEAPSSLEVCLLLCAPLLRETFLRLAYRKLLGPQPDAMFIGGVVHGAELTRILADLRSDHAGFEAASLAAHRLVSVLPLSWSMLDPSSAWYVRALHRGLERLNSTLSLVAPAPEIARVVGSQWLESGHASASQLGRRNLVVVSLAGKDVAVRERALAAILSLAGLMSFDARHLPDWIGPAMRSSDPPTAAGWASAIATTRWSIAEDHLSLRGESDHPAYYEHLVELCDQLQQGMDRARLLGLPGAALPGNVTHRELEPAGSSGDSPRFVLPVPRLAIKSEQVLALVSTENRRFGPSQIALELYKNSLNACMVRAARERYLQCVDGGERAWRGQIVLKCARDDHGTFIECTDNGAGMSRSDLQEHFLTVGAPFLRSRAFLHERNAWIAAGIDLTDLQTFQGTGFSILGVLAHANEMIVESFHRGNLDQVEAWSAHLSARGRVARVLPRAGEQETTRIRVYLAGDELGDPAELLEAVRSEVWIPSFDLTINDESWAAGLVQPALSATCTNLRTFFWCPGRGRVLTPQGLPTDQKLEGMIYQRRDEATTEIDLRSIESLALQEIPALFEASIPTLEWLWNMERFSPALASRIATLIMADHRRPTVANVPVSIQKLGVSCLDARLCAGPPSRATGYTNAGTAVMPYFEPRTQHRGTPSSPEEGTIPRDRTDRADRADRMESGPCSKDLEHVMPRWLLVPRLAAWAAEGVTREAWQWNPEVLEEEPASCPVLQIGDALALSRDLDGIGPWIQEISLSHVVAVAAALGETVGKSIARLGKFAALGLGMLVKEHEALEDLRPTPALVKILKTRACAAWLLIHAARELDVTLEEARRMLEPYSVAKAIDPLPPSAPGRKINQLEASLLERVLATDRIMLPELSVQDLLGAVHAASLILADALAAARELVELGISLAWPPITVAVDWPSHEELAQTLALLEEDGQVRLGAYLAFKDHASSSTASRVAMLLQVLGVPTSHPWSTLDALAPTAPLLRLLSRKNDSASPWLEVIDVWTCAAAIESMGRDDVLRCTEDLVAVGALQPEDLLLLRELAGEQLRPILSWKALVAEKAISLEHVLWISAVHRLPLGEVCSRLEHLRSFGVACPSFEAMQGSELQAHVVDEASTGLIAPGGALRSLHSMSLRNLLDAYHAGGPEAEATFDLLRRMGASVPVIPRLTAMLLSANNDGRPPWRTRPVPFTAIASAAAVHQITVGRVAQLLVSSLQYSDLPAPPKAWEGLGEVKLSSDDVQLIEHLLEGRTDPDGAELRLGAVIQAALLRGKSPSALLGALSWLTRVGVRLPDCPEELVAEVDDLVILSANGDGREPWLEREIEPGQILLASCSLELAVSAVLEKAARYRSCGYTVPPLNPALTAVASRADLVALSQNATALPPWLRGTPSPEHVAMAAGANGEPEEVTWARMARYADLFGFELPRKALAGHAALPASNPVSRIRLVIQNPLDRPRVVEPRERVITIGRTHPCNVIIEDHLVSRVHARLIRRADDSILIMDCKSTNGVWVDGKKITILVVRKDAELHLGKSRVLLRFSTERQVEAPPPVPGDVRHAVPGFPYGLDGKRPGSTTMLDFSSAIGLSTPRSIDDAPETAQLQAAPAGPRDDEI